MVRSPRALAALVILVSACGPSATGPLPADGGADGVLVGDVGPVDGPPAADRRADGVPPGPDAGPDAAADGAPPADVSADGPALPCVTVDDSAPVAVATAGSEDEHLLVLPAVSASRTRWAEVDNEALILEVTALLADQRRFIGHLVLHQGADGLDYRMQVGRLSAGEIVEVKVSTRSASQAVRQACVGPGQLTAAAELGAAAEGLLNAPILIWPVQKRFDDLPVLLGWSKLRKAYQAYYTSENGGTVAQCGGGAEGIEAELARWGRASDIEGLYTYGADPRWGRCTGGTRFSELEPRLEAAHPVLYYGDGHNRLFEHRGGYGQACGSGGAEKADGDLTGWNVDNPGNAAANDADQSITLRLVPVDLDALGYGDSSGRREGAQDTYAPWVFRLTHAELDREGKLDGSHAVRLERYLYADVRASDVGGSGDEFCATLGVGSGFRLRARTGDGAMIDGPQMTADYFGSGNQWKRLAIKLDTVYASDEIDALIFDAYDDDGIYFLELGDVFIVRPSGDNGATIDPVQRGRQEVNVYVDDGSSGCSGGTNSDGPGGLPYPCVGGQHTVTPMR